MDERRTQSDLQETVAPAPSHVSGSASMWFGHRDPSLPDRIGGYRVLGLLGAGGMGQVYLAEQETPRRTVALKVIRPGPGSDQLFKRFQHEVSVLGMLRHHGIAQIYDAGVAESQGRTQPYFAMEYVKGRPIGEHAAATRMDLRGKLELFALVCDAVQHAHLKGVIHRDLKPGNIMVEESGQPKVLDFGVARATDHDLQAVTLQTDIGQLVGTLPYMSPEQVSGDPAELDSRSDVYSLGVVLFELLAGRLPMDVRSRAVTEAIRAVTEDEIPRLCAVARDIPADVDTIVAKSLNRDKSRRYQSAGDLAEDIRRYLRDEPIFARPPSSIYQLTKFAKRHKPLVGATLIVLLTVTTGVIGIAWLGLAAERERKKAEAITEFLASMLSSADPAGIHGRDARIADVLPVASARVEAEMKHQPEIQATIWETIGATYFGLGMYPEAEMEFRRAHGAFERALGENAREAMRLRHNIAVAARHQGRLAEAEDLLREVAEQRARILGATDPDTLRSLDNLATVLRRLGKPREAVQLYRDVLAAQERELGPADEDTLDSRNNLALVLRDLGQLDEAETLLTRTLEQKQRVYGPIKPDHPEILTTRHNLARVLADQGRVFEARAELQSILEARERELGPEHSHTLLTRLALADVLRRSGEHASAEAMLKEIIRIMLERGGRQDATTLAARGYLAASLCARGEFALAEVQAREAVTEATQIHGQDNWITADFQRELGWALSELGRDDEARATLEASVRTLTDRLGAVHWRTRESREILARLLDRLGHADEATMVRSGGVPGSP
jgi:serine/threonine protein kinase/Flp pilus assembly protein TadD